MVSCSVMCSRVLRFAAVCDLLWCAVLCRGRQLETAWNLRVLCSCDEVCTHNCLKDSASAMEYTLVMHKDHQHTPFI